MLPAPPLSHALLEHIASDWPEFAELRAAARALSQKSRLTNAASVAANEIRVALAAAFLGSEHGLGPVTARSEADTRSSDGAVARAQQLYNHARAVVADGAAPLQDLWRFSPDQSRKVQQQLAAVVGLPCEAVVQPRPAPIPTSAPRREHQPLQQGVHLFLAAVSQGLPLSAALTAFNCIGDGAYSQDDRAFYPDNPALGPLADRVGLLHSAQRLVIRGCDGEADTTLFLQGGLLAAVVSPQRLRTAWSDDIRRAAGGLESLPDFIALPRDEAGKPIIPLSRVTALVEAQQAWATELGSLDAVTRSITQGRLVMPRLAAPSHQTWLRNHPSWEKDEDAKRALGPVIAKWLASGVLEYVGWDDRVPILLQPCGAVPKGTAPFYRLITDARFANKLYSDWGVTYTTAAQLSSSLHRCDFHFSIDISDAYHLSLWAGCGGELRPTQRPVLGHGGPGDPGRLSWIDAMVNGCTPSTCKGGCDKDLSGIMIEGFIFRFAACQFGQKTAGSPLGAIVRAVARYFARLSTPVHVASWVDDLIFIMSTPEHGDCAGFEGGCEVCREYHGRAVQVQEMWRRKARLLNIPLSEKGHEVAQRGAYTGLGIDTFRGLYLMLQEKLDAMVSACRELAAAASSTPRRIARVRGKALHYNCAVPFVAVAAPALSQLMHRRENGVGPVSVPTLADEEDLPFDWDQLMPVSDRAKDALQFLLLALERGGNAGRPIWPALASSVYGAFLRGDSQGPRVLVLTYDASVHGWGAILRISPGDPGREIVGGFRTALPLLGSAFLNPSALPDCPAAQIYREALAGLLALQATSQLYDLRSFTLLVRGDCLGALASLRKGSFRSPALQNIALAFNRLLLELGAQPSLFLHAPGLVMKAEGVDTLSRETAAERRINEATEALRRIIVREAAVLGAPLSVDLFATADNALVPRFFARHAEPLAEGVDALAQPDWGLSLCPRCGQSHRECALLFPPPPLLPAALAKARADGLRGVVVLPFTPSHPAWPSIAAVSLTRVPGQRDPCIIVPASEEFVRRGAGTGGPQRLAVMAVDFSRISRRSFADAAPPCPHHRLLRPRRALQSEVDEGDRRRIAAAIRSHAAPATPGRQKRPRGPEAS